MKPDQLIALCVRLFAIALLFYTLRSLVNLTWFLEANDIPGARYAYVGVLAVVIVVTILLWLFPFSVARRIVPEEIGLNLDHRWTESELYGCGFVLLGAYFLFGSVSDALYWIWFLLNLSREQIALEQITSEQIASIVLTVAEMLAAIGLILGSTGLTKIIYKIRYGSIE